MPVRGAATPERVAQWERARAKANAVRFFRAELKRDLKARVRRADEVLLDPPAQLATMEVFDLLVAVPGVGPAKARRIVRRCGVEPERLVGDLAPGERMRLAVAVAAR